MKQKQCSILFHTFLLLSLFALASCNLIFPEHTEKKLKVSHAKSQNGVEAEAFVENLSLSRLLLTANQNNLDGISGNIAVIKAYDSKNSNSKHVKAKRVILVVMDYKTKNDGALRQFIAPATTEDSLPLLQTVLNKMTAIPGTLQNIRLVSATIKPDKSLVLPDELSQLPAVLDQKQATILDQSSMLSPIDDINTQLTLMEFFTKHQDQDAAYLTLDNCKRLLANASQNKTIDESIVRMLSARLESLECTLKVELPYKF